MKIAVVIKAEQQTGPGEPRCMAIKLQALPPSIRYCRPRKKVDLQAGQKPQLDPNVNVREYRLAFRSVDGLVGIYNETGASEDFLSAFQNWRAFDELIWTPATVVFSENVQ